MASILADKYGVQVEIGGDNAMTDGDTIYLPNLPQHCSNEFIGLLRGFLYHESAHIRYSDFELLENTALTDFEKYVWNSIEDWRIEKKLSEHFSGCKANFHWLIHYVFCKGGKRNKKSLKDNLADWLLLKVRSWDVVKLEKQVNIIETLINNECPKLLQELGALLFEVQNKCESSKDAFIYTKAIVACIEKYISNLAGTEISQSQQPGNTAKREGENVTEEQATANGDTSSTSKSDGNDTSVTTSNGNDTTTESSSTSTECSDSRGKGENSHATEGNKSGVLSASRTSNALKQSSIITNLRDLLDSYGTSLPTAIGELTGELIERTKETKAALQIKVATLGIKNCSSLGAMQIQRALRISASLKARLQGLLQAQNLVRFAPASHGKINRNRLHGVAVSDSRVFLQQQLRQATNTSIHILLDTSGSMRGKIDVACETCFSLVNSLNATKGINVAVSAFPARLGDTAHSTHKHNSARAGKGKQAKNKHSKITNEHAKKYVFPVMKHGEKIHRNFQLTAEGGTPLTESLWWLIPNLLKQKEPRKIILIITDGEPDQMESAVHAIESAEKIGVEVYGIGIPPCHVENLFTNSGGSSKCITIENINMLPQAMFGLLQRALLQKNVN